MGLISDYLEDNRERGNYGSVDPCMIMGYDMFPKKNYSSINRDLTRYDTADEDQKKALAEKLIRQIAELEQLKLSYLLADKIILEIINQRHLQSTLVKDTLQTVDEQIQTNYQSICGIIAEIDKKLKHPHRAEPKAAVETQIRKQMLELIMGGILQYLRDGLILDTSGFRKVVDDCAELIRSLEQENYNTANKKIVQYYIEKHYDIKGGHTVCRNCGSPMKIDIPYCLNCYERN